MLIKIRSWAYFLFMASFAILGIAETTVVKDTVVLFEHLPIPSLTKYILPIITISVFVVWMFWIFIRIGVAAEDEMEGKIKKVDERLLRILLESPTVCLVICILATSLLDEMQEHLLSWTIAIDVYSYGILWIAAMPCFMFILEFIQGIQGFPKLEKTTNQYIQRYQTIDGLISTVVALVNLGFVIVIGNMSTCAYSYGFFISLLVFRVFRFHHMTTALWTEEPSQELSDIDKKEGIL